MKEVTLHLNETSDPDLLPCPFCGAQEAYFIETDDQTEDQTFFHVCCNGCEAQSFGCYCVDKFSAAKEWNTRAPLAAPPPPRESEWLPIESAPKDGAWVYGFEPIEDGKYVGHVVMKWREGSWREPGWYTDGGHGYRVCEPTHWRPLPPPPRATSEGDGGC